MAKQVKPIPEGYYTITLHLNIKGAADYIDFLKRAFGAVEISRAPAPSGKLMHAEVRIGNSRLMLSDPFPEFGQPPLTDGNWPLLLHLYVEDADKIYAQAVAAGCQTTMPIGDMFWGDRYGQVKDPFGFTWAISTRKEDVSREEMNKRAAAMFAQRK